MPSASCVTAAVDCCRLANSVWECWTHRGVQEVRGLLIKPCESTRGVARASTAVMVTTGYFLIGLSSAEEDVQRNIQMLKERGWFDIAIVYNEERLPRPPVSDNARRSYRDDLTSSDLFVFRAFQQS